MNKTILVFLCFAVILVCVVSCGTPEQPQDAEAAKTDSDAFDGYIGTWHDEFVPPNVLEIFRQEDGKMACSLGIYRMTTFYLTVTADSEDISFVDENDLIAGKIELADNGVLVTVEESNTELVQAGAEYIFSIRAETKTQ